MVSNRGLFAWIGRAAASRAPEWVAAGIILLGSLLDLFLNFPGHLTYDSVVQLAEGRTGSYSGAHPPVMSWLLGLADAIRPGAGVFVILDVVMICGALTALVLIAQRASWLTPALAAAAFVTPQLLIYPAIVWKDVLFAGSACAAFACLAWAGEIWARRGWRNALIGAALALATLAALARQNGAVVAPFAGAALGWIAARATGRGRGVAWGGGFAAACGALTLIASAGLATRVDDPNPIGGAWTALHTYDLVGALVLEPRLDLGVLAARDPKAAWLLRTHGVAQYSPERIDSIEPVADEINGEGQISGLIAAQWRAFVLRRPFLYLRVRADQFRWVFLQPRPLDCVLIETGVDGPADELALSGLAERDTAHDDALSEYALAFAGTPVYSHAAYAAVAGLLLVPLLRRRRSSDIAVAAMVLSALAFAASFFVITVACDYRYLYFLDLAAIAAALYAAASLGRASSSAPPGRRRPAQGTRHEGSSDRLRDS